MDGQKTKAFTLVELIVVITILAILGTIAFISLQGYSTSARDSTRVSDLSSMKSSLELFHLDAGNYPQPTDAVAITYSGATVWNQGTFGETVFANVDRLDKIPTDPLTDKEYTYSVTSTKNQYQLGGMVEGDEVSLGKLTSANAGTTEAQAYITGNYNEQITKSLSGTLCNVLALPSIITNDTSITDLQQIVASGSLVYRGFKNLPASFKDSKFKADGGFAFQPNTLVAYTDTSSCEPLTDNSSYTARVNLLKGLQDAYSGTIVQNEGELKNIMALTINTSSPSSEVVSYAGNYVNNVLKGKVSTGGGSSTTTTYSNQTITCLGSLPVNATATTATTYTQTWNGSAWSPTTSWGENQATCDFNCNSGYSWNGSSCALIITGWRLLDTNCDIPDITIGSQVWAGCNSTLGTGFEWGKTDAGTNGTVASCYPNYNATNDTVNCVIGSTAMASNSKANTWFTGTNSNGDQEYPAIWGKLYTWVNAPSACPTGRHLPSDAEWETLETTLNGGTNCRNATSGWLCTGLGWMSHNTKTDTNNLANRLKIPLAGYRYTDGSSFYYRGNGAYLWSSSAFDASLAYYRSLYYGYATVIRNISSKTYGFSVRCVKD